MSLEFLAVEGNKRMKIFSRITLNNTTLRSKGKPSLLSLDKFNLDLRKVKISLSTKVSLQIFFHKLSVILGKKAARALRHRKVR